jgi:SAM-dependent methyltransferase
MDEETIRLLTDLHAHNPRQGPGSYDTFQKALSATGIDTNAIIEMADIGCGTGSATIPLLKQTSARVTAVDFIPTFLAQLKNRAHAAGVLDRLTLLEADMADLPFHREQFDAIWSEGAIYNIGFSEGIHTWRDYLKLGGTLAVSELTWLTDDVPEPLRAHWEHEYPEVATATEKIAVLTAAGYELVDHFFLPPCDWLTHYYEPLQAGLPSFLQRNHNSAAAQAVAATETEAIKL